MPLNHISAAVQLRDGGPHVEEPVAARLVRLERRLLAPVTSRVGVGVLCVCACVRARARAGVCACGCACVRA